MKEPSEVLGMCHPKIAYVTARTPFGAGETFVLEEMLALDKLGIHLTIVPRNPPPDIFHKEAQALIEKAVWLPLVNMRMIGSFAFSLLTKAGLRRLLASFLHHSRTWRILAKNLAVLPKAAHVARILEEKGVERIHAHWGSTTATMAWAMSVLTDIPWSVTLHRWDIGENNMLKAKVEHAAFVRCISEDGKQELLAIVGAANQDKVKVLHMGVCVPDTFPGWSRCTRSKFVIACPANLRPVKGHRFLIEACALLKEKNVGHIRCLIIGDGPLETEIRQQVAQLGLADIVELVGRLPHEALMQMYEKGQVDAVVLPSIVTEDGEREGIPVSLMEAMAYGVPVISTKTGGIPELVKDGTGMLVEPESAEALSGAIEKLMHDESLQRELGERGHAQVRTEFNVERIAEALLALMRPAGG